MKRSNLPSETTMYSVDRVSGKVIPHHLPWARTSPQLEKYTAKGFTFERPAEVQTPPKIIPTDEEILAAARCLDAASVPTDNRKIETLEGFYRCGKCKSPHMETSGVGKKHLKFKEA